MQREMSIHKCRENKCRDLPGFDDPDGVGHDESEHSSLSSGHHVKPGPQVDFAVAALQPRLDGVVAEEEKIEYKLVRLLGSAGRCCGEEGVHKLKKLSGSND